MNNAPSTPDGLPMGMPSARKLTAHELCLLLLALLDEEAGHGSALSERIEQLSQGFYRPSPGSLYPALSKLLDQGCIDRSKQGRLKIYRLTDKGRQQYEANRQAAERTRSRLTRAGHKLNAMRRAYTLSMPDEDSSALAHAMLEARMDLKAALHDSLTLSPSQQRSIIQALHQAASTIRALDTEIQDSVTEPREP